MKKQPKKWVIDASLKFISQLNALFRHIINQTDTLFVLHLYTR